MAGRIAYAAGIIVVFFGVALLMARSARNDWREGKAKQDRIIRFYAHRQFGAVIFAVVVGVAAAVKVLSG